jgi:hypothetical protein
VRQVVDGEGELVAVLAERALVGDDAGVVDEDIQALVVALDLLGQSPYLG